MKLRVIKRGFRYYCQYKTFLFWRTFRDRTLNKRSNLKVWFGNLSAANEWIKNYEKT